VAEMVGPEKVLFGSDFPLLPLSRYLRDLEKADLDETVRKGILGENVSKLLKKNFRD